jgi:uncharacterized protein YkwD
MDEEPKTPSPLTENPVIQHGSDSGTEAPHEKSLDAGPRSPSDDNEPIASTTLFQYLSISYSIMRSINMYREVKASPRLFEDPRLVKVAMNHSKKMSNGKVSISTEAIEEEMNKLPFVHRYAIVAQFSSMNNAFTNVVNQWTTDKEICPHLCELFNCSGAGLWINSDKEVFFTLVLGLRSHIASSLYTGSTIRSILIAEKCLGFVNQIRTKDFELLELGLDLRLCDLAYRYTELSMQQLTTEYCDASIGDCASYQVGFGSVDDIDASPQAIVENWMNQVGREKTILGDVNRVGFGFRQDTANNKLISVGIYVRSIQAAILDGTETVIDGEVLARQLGEMLNEFRLQHSLAPLKEDSELSLIALEHSEYIANESDDPNPLNVDPFVSEIEPRYVATDISHMFCREISRAPKTFMEKWRNNVDCISVILNQVDDMGIGVCFDADYTCHATVIVGSYGNEAEIVNVIYRF